MCNNLLVSSAKGAQWIDINKNHFTKLIVSDKGPASAFQNDLFDAAFTNHRICVTSTYTGVYAFDSTGKLIFRYDYYKPDSKGNIISNGHYGLAVIHSLIHTGYCILIENTGCQFMIAGRIVFHLLMIIKIVCPTCIRSREDC